MKNRLIIKYSLFVSALFFLFMLPTSVSSQESVDDFKMLFKLNTIKQSDNTRLLEVEFLARNKEDKKDKIAVADAEITFFNVTEDEEFKLGSSKTDNLGIAQLTIPADHKYLSDEEGYITITAVYEGSDEMDEEEEEVMFLDLQLEMTLSFEDSIQMVYVKAYTLDSLGEELLIEELDMIIGVESMLSKMPLDEGTLEEGEYEFEMPMDIPGDQNGDLVVYAFVEDHEDFINVEKSEKINWGKAKSVIDQGKNELWTEAAPIWMYFVLTIMLGGVWVFYFYAVRNLFKIKKMGNN